MDPHDSVMKAQNGGGHGLRLELQGLLPRALGVVPEGRRERRLARPVSETSQLRVGFPPVPPSLGVDEVSEEGEPPLHRVGGLEHFLVVRRVLGGRPGEGWLQDSP